jgi:hypothetical protein
VVQLWAVLQAVQLNGVLLCCRGLQYRWDISHGLAKHEQCQVPAAKLQSQVGHNPKPQRLPNGLAMHFRH